MSNDIFSDIANDLRNISGELSEVSSRLVSVDDKVDQIASDLQVLSTEYHSFLDTYTQNTELQLAETRINTVRQRLEKEFGHYAEVRRHTTGILQAVDTGLVRRGTIRTAAENLMISTPRYWLTPCLLALSAWLDNDKELTENAKSEAVTRNDEKASLFFSLVSRRGNRYHPSRMWLDRYLSIQDPAALPEDMVVVVDAYANGIFGPDMDGLCIKRFQGWMDHFGKQEGFEEKQKNQWKAALLSVRRDISPEEEGYLKQYSPTYPRLADAISGARIHTSLFSYFSSILEEKEEPVDGIISAVDGILDTLVTEYDEEERELKNKEHALELIIDEGGNKDEADRRLSLIQQSDQRTMDFTQVLTNAALHPEVYSSSLTCRRFAVAMSREWITRAYKEITAENRQAVPHEIEFQIGSWSASTVDGGNESELAGSIQRHIDQELSKTLVDIKVETIQWLPGIIGGIFLLWGIPSRNIAAILIGAVGIGWLYYQYSRVTKKKAQVKAHFVKMQADLFNIARAMLAEVVDWKTAYAHADADSRKVEDLLETMLPEHYVQRSFLPGRTIITQPAKGLHSDIGSLFETGAELEEDERSSFASQFPSWDLLPPLISSRRKSA